MLSCIQPENAQRGAVLVVSLMILLLMTLLGVTAMRTANFELVMATNTQARSSAMAVAENALVDGEVDIVTNYGSTPLFDWSSVGTDGLYTVGDAVEGVAGGNTLDDISWDSATGAYQAAPSGGKYTLEYLGPYTTAGASLTLGGGGASDKRYLYRVSGRGEFGKGGTRFVQSIYATRD